MTVVNIHAPNIHAPGIGAPAFIKQTLLDIKGQENTKTIIVSDFNSLLSRRDSSRNNYNNQ